MTFASLTQDPVADLTKRFSQSGEMTLLVGAGGSMEAGLPSWRTLIGRLLNTIAEAQPELDTQELRTKWAKRILERDDLLGAAAVVEVMAAISLDVLVPEHLYGDAGASGYRPGPIARQIAELRRCFDENLEILTTNYDDLIERALIDTGLARSRIRSYTSNRSPNKRAVGTTAVTHLHGLAAQNEEPKKIVLTEEHYHRMQRGTSWQEKLVTERLKESRCLFVGTSLADPNLIRYLYGYDPPETPRHAAIFVREGEPECSAAVRAALEQSAAKRWGRCGVEAVFVDHFADAAQLLYEIRYRHESGDDYKPIAERAAKLIEFAEGGLNAGGQKEFARRQVIFSEGMRAMLAAVVDALADIDVALPSSEKLSMALWLLSTDGKHLTGWIHSDRAHQDPTTMSPVPIGTPSNWIAVRAVCRGTLVQQDLDNYASRWRFVRGLPIVLEQPSRVPIGCLTLTSTRSEADSVLSKMPPVVRNAVHEYLVAMASRLVSLLISTGERERMA
jgi:NAD-dependent SIR2 family protein deacetylase